MNRKGRSIANDLFRMETGQALQSRKLHSSRKIYGIASNSDVRESDKTIVNLAGKLLKEFHHLN